MSIPVLPVPSEKFEGYDPGDYRFLEHLPVNIDWLIGLMLYKLIKEQPKVAQQIVNKWLDNQARVCVALAQASPGNPVSSWGHTHLIAQIMEHAYMIRKGGAKSIMDGMNWLTGATIIGSFLGQVSGPASLVYSTAKGATPTQVARIAKAIK